MEMVKNNTLAEGGISQSPNFVFEAPILLELPDLLHGVFLIRDHALVN
jgi:hypothetical protein